MTDQERIKSEGYTAGLASPNGIQCPYDGRTRAGKAWWDGFMAGDAKRCAAKQWINSKGEVVLLEED
jgi:ribosome modulation factor